VHELVASGKVRAILMEPIPATFQKLAATGVKEVDIETLSVPSLTLETLIAQNGIGRIGFLQVDTKGYDAEVVRMALRLAAPPPFINFDNVHLPGGPGLNQLFEQLKAAGYSWVDDKWNTLAIHQSAAQAFR
jgi:hypothetical protein